MKLKPAIAFFLKDWLLIILDIKFRVRDPGTDTWPRIFRQGSRVVLHAPRFMSPPRNILWLGIRGIVSRITVLMLLAAGVVLFMPDWKSGHPTAIGAVMTAVLVLLVLRTRRHEDLGCVLVGKELAIEFMANKIKLYEDGYGLSWPVTIPRAGLDISSDINEHERGRIEAQKLGRSPEASENAAVTYQNSFWVNLIVGNRIQRVAEVYGELTARRLSAAIKHAEELRQQIARERAAEKAMVENLPE